ncbi:transcription initiation factor IIF subunit alpha-like [Rhododendron vialii]|uniref:transcription initiation factor IIF subunit alpha-like n=1 Tax=Rhododendron vialii TaxID=182163 RepID=UPI00265F68B8|nr:transcription initiation factor IIF subunit alpha-like [Rhododendron vialii]
MSFDLVLKPCCGGCGSSKDLYGSNCKHLTLCFACGKTMAEDGGKCCECGATITRLIREYKIRACSSSDKNFFIGRFATGLPISISSKRNAQNKWSLLKEGLLGRQLTEALREKYKNKPWLLVNEMGQSQYHGYLEGAPSSSFYLLMMQGKEFVAIPAGSWYNFNKVAQYKQLTLEEAEEKMKNRRKTADGYQRWMMKAANNGPAAFGEVEKIDDKERGASCGRGRKKPRGDDGEANASDNGEDDEEEQEEAARNITGGGLFRRGNNDDEEGTRGGDLDLDDDDFEKGDDWEHEETFTDDDEAVGNDPEEREDLGPEIPAPPEIKQDEDETNEEEGGLSQSGKELKKLLGRACGSNVMVVEGDDGNDDINDDISPVLAPNKKDALKEGPANNIKGTPTISKSAKGNRELNREDAKASDGAPPKKVKTENEAKSSKDKPSSSSKHASTDSSAGPVTEDEIRAVLLQKSPVTAKDLVNVYFKARLRCDKDKDAFKAIFKRICKIEQTDGQSYVVLSEKGMSNKAV